nr:hypothetical protein [uncultured Celeribacter sp.]
MKTAKYIAEAESFSLNDLVQLFSELESNGCSLMIRSDAERQSNVFTCAIAVVGDPAKSVRRDAETLNDAVIFCLRDYLTNSKI